MTPDRLPIFDDLAAAMRWSPADPGAYRPGALRPDVSSPGALRPRPLQEPPTVTAPAPQLSTPPPPPYIRRPRSAAPTAYTARQVAAAMGAPVDRYDGSGVTAGFISLGGALDLSDLTSAGLPTDKVTVVPLDGARPVSDGPNGADGENSLDAQNILSVAPGVALRMYAAPNSDTGFLHAFQRAIADCDVVSCSWGGPESSWDAATLQEFSAVLAAGRARGVPIFVAAGDAGSRDGTRRDTVDYPASDPSVIGCGGTRLTLNSDGTRATEVVWNDDPTTSATGGGVSAAFPGRTVPDVAADADPDTGYVVYVDGRAYVIGGTSAVAPLYAGGYALLRQATGGKPVDFLNTVLTNPEICFDVTSGNNGGYKAGPGRDNVSGYGVVDLGKMLAVLTSGTQVPAPGGNAPTDPAPPNSGDPAPPSDPTPQPTPDPTPSLPSDWQQVVHAIARDAREIAHDAADILARLERLVAGNR